MLWLDDIETVIDTIWSHVTSDSLIERQGARVLVDEWPWKTLRPPRDTVKFRHYWSNDIDELLREFSGKSGTFCWEVGALTVKDWSEQKSESIREDGSEGMTRTARVWHNRLELLSIMKAIRQAANADLLNDG